MKFQRLKVIGFSSKAGRECFAIIINANHGNILVEDSTFSDPAPDNTETITVIRLAHPEQAISNTVVRRCTIGPLRAFAPTTQAFQAVDVEECLVTNCTTALYFEPEVGPGQSVGPVLLRSNRFVDVSRGMYLNFHPGTHFDSVTLLNNEMVLSPGIASGIGACDVCNVGPSGTTTNITALNNVIRYADWAPRPANTDNGLYYSDIQHGLFGNNLVALGTAHSLELRHCPAGYIPPVSKLETCDNPAIVLVPESYPQCLDTLPTGYTRAWFGNRDLQGNLLKIRYVEVDNPNSSGFASQQQWPR